MYQHRLWNEIQTPPRPASGHFQVLVELTESSGSADSDSHLVSESLLQHPLGPGLFLNISPRLPVVITGSAAPEAGGNAAPPTPALSPSLLFGAIGQSRKPSSFSTGNSCRYWSTPPDYSPGHSLGLNFFLLQPTHTFLNPDPSNAPALLPPQPSPWRHPIRHLWAGSRPPPS